MIFEFDLHGNECFGILTVESYYHNTCTLHTLSLSQLHMYTESVTYVHVCIPSDHNNACLPPTKERVFNKKKNAFLFSVFIYKPRPACKLGLANGRAQHTPYGCATNLKESGASSRHLPHSLSQYQDTSPVIIQTHPHRWYISTLCKLKGSQMYLSDTPTPCRCSSTRSKTRQVCRLD